MTKNCNLFVILGAVLLALLFFSYTKENFNNPFTPSVKVGTDKIPYDSTTVYPNEKSYNFANFAL